MATRTKPIPVYLTSEKVPKGGEVVFVAGGTALWSHGRWFSGQYPIEWPVKWWAAIPTDSDVLIEEPEPRKFPADIIAQLTLLKAWEVNLDAACQVATLLFEAAAAMPKGVEVPGACVSVGPKNISVEWMFYNWTSSLIVGKDHHGKGYSRVQRVPAYKCGTCGPQCSPFNAEPASTSVVIMALTP